MLVSANKSPNFISPAIHSLVHSLLPLWPLWLLIGLAALGKLAFEVYELRRLARSGIAEIDRMDGKTFEVFLGTLFRRLGYTVEITRYRGDYGADLVVSKDGERTAVQAKRWSKRVGLKAVQEAAAAKGYYRCQAALVVANREFTKQAQALARANDVTLWDRNALAGKLLATHEEAPADEARAPFAQAQLEPAPTSASPASADTTAASTAGVTAAAETASTVCVVCGAGVSDTVRDYCVARPVRFRGQIFCLTHQRASRRRKRHHPTG